MKRFFSVLAAVVAGHLILCAQSHNHHGHDDHDHNCKDNSCFIVEDQTEDDVPFASVLIVETGQGVNADEYGMFQFTNMPEGQYTLKVQLIGYESKEQKVTVRKDKPVEMHVYMTVQGIMTEEVVVSASRNAVKRCEAPVVVNVLNQKLFERTNSTDLAKTLNYLAWVLWV